MLNSNNEFYKTLNILYIETNKSTSRFFSNILLKIFKSVKLIDNYNEALYFCTKEKKEKIDIIISDMQLDNYNKGIDLLIEIRKIDEKIPFILTTGVIDSDELIVAIKENATDFLIKPLNVESLLKCVEKISFEKYHEELKKQATSDLDDLFQVVNEVALVSKTNIDGEIIFANKALCEVSGYTNEELIGNRHGLFRDTNVEILKELRETIHSGNIWEGKIKNISKSGEEFHVYLTVMPIYDENKAQIKEFMWIRFLATDYELEQKNFRKKVAENLNNNRRINNEARDKIDGLINKLNFYRSLDSQFEEEKHRNDKFISQYNYFLNEIEEKEKKLNDVMTIARNKINEVLVTQKKTKIKRDEVALTLDGLTNEFELKNKTIKELTKELDTQKKMIDKLMTKIDFKETQLGMKD